MSQVGKYSVRVLLYKGRGLIGSPVMWQTRGPYSHAAIQIGDRVYESRFLTGVVNRQFGAKDILADRYVVELTDVQIPRLEKWLDEQVGKKYDLTMVFRFITRMQEARRSSGKWFCSEYVYAGFQKVGVELLARTEPWEVSPNLLRRSPKLRLEERIKKGK